MRRLSQDKIKRILKLREDGCSYHEIMNEGFSYYAVARYCSGFRPELKCIAYKQLSQEDKDKVTQFRRRGLTCKEISEKLNISIGTIKKICKEFCPGLRFIARQKFKQVDVQGMVYYNKNGYSMVRIAKIFKCNRTTVWRILQNYYKNLQQ